MTTERVITFTRDWPKNLSKHVIAYLCGTCTMLTCCDSAAGCKLRQELRERDREYYQQRRPKVLAARKAAYRADPDKFYARCHEWRSRNRQRARDSAKAWREARKDSKPNTVAVEVL